MNGEAQAGTPGKRRRPDGEASTDELERDLARTRAEMDETLRAIEHRLSPGELMDQALDYLRGAPKEFVTNLGSEAKSNPIPVALLGISLAWLMMSRRPGYSYPQEYTSEGLAEPMARGLSEAGERAGEKGKEWQGEATERMAVTREEMGRMAEEFRHRARGMAAGVRQSGREMAESLRYGGEKARGSFSQLLDEQPWVLGALGIALGAAFGAGLPISRRERETLGPASDELMRHARETGREEMEKTRDTLREAVSGKPTVHSGPPSGEMAGPAGPPPEIH